MAHLEFLGDAHIGKGLGYIEDDELTGVLCRHRTGWRARLEGTPNPTIASSAMGRTVSGG